jgi:hypothetical protein
MPAGAGVAGCSLVDGWGGLEGGGDGGNGAHDAAMSTGADGDGVHDSAAATSDAGDGAATTVGASCGNTHCDSSKNEGCCTSRMGGASTCELATACTGQGSVFVACDDSSECGSGGTCCLEYTAGVASCTTGACQGLVLCAASGGTCPAGTHCIGAGATGFLPSGYYICM